MSAPTVTVVIPTHARPAQLEACLAGIAKLNPAPGGLEIVVVDDGGPHSLEPLIAALAGPIAGTPGGAGARRSGKGSQYRSRNVEEDASSPSSMMTVFRIPDGSRHWCVSSNADADHLLGGRVTNGLPDDPYATATQSITTYARHYYRSEAANEPFFTTNNLALSTERFRHVGGFDTSIRSWTSEDREFCDRWRSFNYPMAEVLDA